jgi:hypothetical protein
VIGAAVMVPKIATGEIEDPKTESSPAAELGRKGGRARAAKLSSQQRRKIAQKAAKRGWDK